MSDVPPRDGAHHLPPCPFSKHCERVLDIEASGLSQNDALNNAEDQQFLEQLQAHIPSCPTCNTILTQERTRRAQQRQLFRQFLTEGEQKVPSTTARIMQAVNREREEHIPSVYETSSNGHTTIKDITSVSTATLMNMPLPHRGTRNWTQDVSYRLATLVAVLAIILVSTGLFSHMFLLRGQVGTGTHVSPTIIKSVQATPVTHTIAWSSIIVTLVKDGQKRIMAMDPISGKSAVLATSGYPDTTVIDSVSHDGYQVLYHVFDGTKTHYYLQPAAQNALLYTLNGKGGPAIWSTDNLSVFISTPQGIEKVDVNSRSATVASPLLKMPDLRFYRDGYLYFAIYGDRSVLTGLNRINVVTGEIAPVGTQCKLPQDFWLGPDGTMVYYHCEDQAALYAVKSDGTGGYVVRDNTGQIIGYAAQDEPLIMQNVRTMFQVIELGLNAQHDRVLVSDVAPGAAKLTADTVAVAPYGEALVALAQYADGSVKLWNDDLVSNKQSPIPMGLDAQGISQMVLVGWSRLGVV